MAPIPSPTSNRLPLPDLHHQQIHPGGGAAAQFGHPAAADHDDFFDQMLSALPTAWSDLGNPKSPWDLGGEQKLFSIGTGENGTEETADGMEYPPYDESSLLASRLRQHQISGGDKPIGIQLNHPSQQHQQQLLFSGMGRSPGASDLMLPLPLSLGADDIIARSQDEPGREGMYNGYGAPIQQHFQNSQSYGAAPVGPPPAAAGGGGAAAVPPRQRVRARRGQATDPHSIAERLRRERIAERMKALQELVPNANKTDKASMLDEIIDYVKFLQLQVKVLSMSRLGGAGAVAPLVADISSEAGRGGNAAGSDSLTVTEHQVAKLMEEDMGTAMQYLQGKGLCLMPISLASAISTAGCTTRNSGGVAVALSGLLGGASPGLMLAPPASVGNNNGGVGGDGPTSPSMSVLTVQSAMANVGDASSGMKEVGSVSKP